MHKPYITIIKMELRVRLSRHVTLGVSMSSTVPHELKDCETHKVLHTCRNESQR